MARALIAADTIIQKSGYKRFRNDRYASFDIGQGVDYESGPLSLSDLQNIAIEFSEPKPTSGRQE